MYPLMKILPSVATTPFFTLSEILVDGIGMQVEELHSGATRNLPVLVFPTLVSSSPHVFESVFVKIEVTPRKFLVVGNWLLSWKKSMMSILAPMMYSCV